MKSYLSNAQKCREALIVLADCAQFDLAAYEALANITSTNAAILASVRTYSAHRNVTTDSPALFPSTHPRHLPSFA